MEEEIIGDKYIKEKIRAIKRFVIGGT